MPAPGRTGAIVTMLCDDGQHYVSTCFDAAWRTAQGLEVAALEAQLDELFAPPPG